ncbi:MAG TPA: YihY/virulence factor BrkB family protein [Anaerolineae bacterium]|nr:YihY/virulence factor BrkB family protein [Anaerolineae bacterium]
MSQPDPVPQPKSTGNKLVMVAKEIYGIWVSERPSQFAAALAYYAIFSFVPLIYIAFTVTELVVARLSVEEQFYAQVANLLGAEIAQALQDAVIGLAQRTGGDTTLTTVIGFVALAFTASLAFFQLQHTLNTVWKVPPPRRGQTRAYVLNRLLALVMVLGVALLLVVAAVANLLVSLINARVEWGGFVSAANLLGLAALAALSFALIYKVLPNAKVAWRHIWVGAGVAALLLAAGLSLVKLYLSASRFSSALEAAGAAAVFLTAFYYLGQIFVLGAVVIRVLAAMSGSEIVPREDPSELGDGLLEEEGQ